MDLTENQTEVGGRGLWENLPKKTFGHVHFDHFINTSFDFEHIKNACKYFSVIHGDNDTAIPFKNAVELSNSLSCELISISNGGHLNGSAGWYELPELLESLEKMMK